MDNMGNMGNAALGLRLKALRTNNSRGKKLTQRDVAAFASDSGREGYTSICKIENGKLNPSHATAAIFILLSLLTEEQINQAEAIMEDLFKAPPT